MAHIYSVIMLQRLDKRKDRVEISPEQLSDASTQAEVVTKCLSYHTHSSGAPNEKILAKYLKNHFLLS